MRYLVSLLLVVVLALSGVGLCFADGYKVVTEPTGKLSYSIPEKGPEILAWNVTPVGMQQTKRGPVFVVLAGTNEDETVRFAAVVMVINEKMHIIQLKVLYMATKKIDSYEDTEFFKSNKPSDKLDPVKDLTSLETILRSYDSYGI